MQPNASSSPADDPRPDAQPKPPLSLSRLREAFVAMLGPTNGRQEPAGGEQQTVDQAQAQRPALVSDSAEISPRSVVEAMLFVGQSDNRPLSAREMAAAMRGVGPSEIDAAVDELNALYDKDGTPYKIESTPAGYKMSLRKEFERLRDKFYGRAREAKLSPAALEVLSVVAYNQPATLHEINEIRGAPSGAILSTLVRRRLLQLQQPGTDGNAARYSTTERFLRLFGLVDLASLPRSEDLEKL